MKCRVRNKYIQNQVELVLPIKKHPQPSSIKRVASERQLSLSLAGILSVSRFAPKRCRRVLHATCNGDVMEAHSQSEPAKRSRRTRSSGYTERQRTFSQINCRIITYVLTRPPPPIQHFASR